MDWLRSKQASGAYDWGNPLDEQGIGEELQSFMNSGEGGNKAIHASSWSRITAK